MNVQMDNLCNLYTVDLMDDVSTVINEMRFPLPKSEWVHETVKRKGLVHGEIKRRLLYDTGRDVIGSNTLFLSALKY